MLKEILGVADDPPAKRRWFHDDFFDLFVWQSGGEVTLFQLCYGADAVERALVWDKARGFFHDGPQGEDVISRFEDAAAALPDDIRQEIRQKVHEFAGTRKAVTTRRKRFRRAFLPRGQDHGAGRPHFVARQLVELRVLDVVDAHLREHVVVYGERQTRRRSRRGPGASGQHATGHRIDERRIEPD